MHPSVIQMRLCENPTCLLLLYLLEKGERVYFSSGCASFCLRGEWEWSGETTNPVSFFLMVWDNLKRILLSSLLIPHGAKTLQEQWESHAEGLAEVGHDQGFIFSQRTGGSMDSCSISHCFNGPTCLHYQRPPPQAQILELELTTPTSNFFLLVHVSVINGNRN